jgi:hypothetical protein
MITIFFADIELLLSAQHSLWVIGFTAASLLPPSAFRFSAGKAIV